MSRKESSLCENDKESLILWARKHLARHLVDRRPHGRHPEPLPHDPRDEGDGVGDEEDDEEGDLKGGAARALAPDGRDEVAHVEQEGVAGVAVGDEVGLAAHVRTPRLVQEAVHGLEGTNFN